MTQNIYDNPEFFRRYSQFSRSLNGLDGAPEWPALRSMLPDLQRRRVLDLGCGFGWFSRWAREHGALKVVAMDVSEKMLMRAIEMTFDDAITYERVDLEEAALPELSFDLVFSSMALHYIENIASVFASVHRAMLPGGSFVFSMEHPIYMAPRVPGWTFHPDGQRTWPVDQYQIEGPRVTDWLTNGVVKYHRTIGTTINLLVRSGFSLDRIEEWGPTQEQLETHPDYSEHLDRPMFLLISARK